MLAVGCPPGSHSYNLRGEVIATGPGADQITVKHEDVPGFMSAMTMVFPVKRRNELRDVVPGDIITAVVVTTNNGMDYRLKNVHVVDRSGEQARAPAPSPPKPR